MEEAHKNFKTKIVDGQKTEFVPDGKPGIPPKNSKFSLVNYPSKLGEMPMYITAKENNGKKYPAIIYLNGGFGGIGDSKFDWDEESPKNNYQGADAFKRDDFVLAIPTVRGENANPGKYEMFYGEIEDLEEARKYVASLPYVDPNRIYLVKYRIAGGDHFNIIYPLTTMIAQKILADTGTKTNIQFTAEDLEKISKNIVK